MSEKFNSEKYSLVEESPVGGGMEAEVSFVKMERGGRTLNLIRKRPQEDSLVFDKEQIIERFKKSVRMYGILKDKKYPVPQTWRIDENTNDLYVSDLSDGGRLEIIDTRRLGKIMRGKEGSPVKLSAEVIEKLRLELKDICARATRDNIVIPADTWFIVADKNGKSADLVLGDISGVNDMEGSGISRDIIEDTNIKQSVSMTRGLDQLL